MILLLFPLFSPRAAEAGVLGLSLSPSIFEANIKPGKTITQVFTLKNNSAAEQTFVARVIPFTPGDALGNPSLRPNLLPEWLKYFSLSNSDIKLNEPFVLAANQSTQLILTINVPGRTGSGDLYSTLLVSSVVKDTPNVSSTMGAAIGSNLLLTISPLSHPPSLVRISDFAPTKTSFLFRYADVYLVDSLTPIYFSATAKNLGKYFVKSAGALKVEKNGANVSTQNLLANNILSNSERVLEGSPSGQLVYKPSLTSFGNYLVTLDLRNENSSSHAELTTLVLPIKITAVTTIAILVISSIIKVNKKKSDVKK